MTASYIPPEQLEKLVFDLEWEGIRFDRRETGLFIPSGPSGIRSFSAEEVACLNCRLGGGNHRPFLEAVVVLLERLGLPASTEVALRSLEVAGALWSAEVLVRHLDPLDAAGVQSFWSADMREGWIGYKLRGGFS